MVIDILVSVWMVSVIIFAVVAILVALNNIGTAASRAQRLPSSKRNIIRKADSIANADSLIAHVLEERQRAITENSMLRQERDDLRDIIANRSPEEGKRY